jgi:hypothetical protein
MTWKPLTENNIWFNTTASERFDIIKKPDFDYHKYWNQLDNDLIDSLCEKPDFDFRKYLNKLSCYQQFLIVINNNNFDYEIDWKPLHKETKTMACFYKLYKYWDEYTSYDDCESDFYSLTFEKMEVAILGIYMKKSTCINDLNVFHIGHIFDIWKGE